MLTYQVKSLIKDPGLSLPPETYYIASYRFGGATEENG